MAVLGTAFAAAEAVSAEANPYTVISDRNIFRLNPPPPPTNTDASKTADLPKVILTGFVGKGTLMKVLMAIPPKDNKDPTFYLSLAPGEADHQVELVKIHLDKEEVEIINSGTPETLSVKSNSYASIGSPAARPPGGGAPGVPGMPGFRRSMPGLPQMNAQPPPAPAAPMTSSGGSAVIVGQGGGDTPTPFGSFGSSSSGVSVSGGPGFSSASTAAAANNAGSSIANGLFNQQNGQYRMPTPTAPAAPPEIQAAQMLLQKTTMSGGGPPLPPPLAEMMGNQ